MMKKNEIKLKQINFFLDNHIAINNGYLNLFNDNLYIPLKNGDEDKLAFENGNGGELIDKKKAKAKMKAVISSSALCVNFFKYWKDNDRYTLSNILNQYLLNSTIPAESILPNFETKHNFGVSKDRQIVGPSKGNIDFEIKTNNFIVLLECKFTEDFSNSGIISKTNSKIYEKVFKDYFIDINDIFRERKGRKFYQLAQRLIYTIENKNETIRNISNKLFLFLYYDYDNFNIHREFGDLVKDEYKEYYKSCSYQLLFNEFEKYLIKKKEKKHNKWIEYMRERYFTEYKL